MACALVLTSLTILLESSELLLESPDLLLENPDLLRESSALQSIGLTHAESVKVLFTLSTLQAIRHIHSRLRGVHVMERSYKVSGTIWR